MDLISLHFIIAVLSAFVLYYWMDPKYRNSFLLILSCTFIALLDLLLLPYIILFSLLNFMIGLRLASSSRKKALYRAGLILNIGQLLLLHYADFAVDPLLSLFISDFQVSSLSRIIVPFGISYFTLQSIGYLINIKMGWEKPEKNFLDFLLYITFFPKFISGPIERSNHFLPEIRKPRPFNEQQVTEGLRIALFGFFKKIVIANRLAPLVMGAHSSVETTSALWIILFLQPLYLYFDFSGYTDIARGVAKLFGIDLLPNFNKPFFAHNVTLFWKKFHMSLSFWFNDYIFRQLSFRYRKWGIFSSSFAVMITFLLFGIWHGGSWSFLFLGFLQAVAINFEFFTKQLRSNFFSRLPGRSGIWTGRFLTYIFYSGSLVFFFSGDLNSAFKFFERLFENNAFQISLDLPKIALLSAIIILIYEMLKNDYGKISERIESYFNDKRKINIIYRWSFYYLVIMLILLFVNSEVPQFIYFAF
jgi:alginate O-acetyltransferase complex protein AlgI